MLGTPLEPAVSPKLNSQAGQRELLLPLALCQYSCVVETAVQEEVVGAGS